MRRREARCERDGSAQLSGRIRQLVLLTEHEPEVIAGLCVIRTEPNRCFKRSACAVDIASPPSRRAEVILRVEQFRLKRNRAREMLERRIGLSKLPTNVAEAIVRGGQSWGALQRPFVRVGGA